MADGVAFGPGFDLVAAKRSSVRRQAIMVAVVLAALAVWSARGTQFDIPGLLEGMPKFIELLSRMLPPDLSVLPKLAGPLLETVEMALLGTTLAIIFAVPLAFFAANNVSPHPVISAVARVVIGGLRTVPELVWAMILVTAVGLGPFPGVLALTLHSIGGLGKFYYEAIEASDPGLIEAMQTVGANRMKVFCFGVLPNVLPVMISSTLFYWEYNNRASTVLGLVGAGGIGLALTHALSDFRYQEVSTCLLLIVAILIVIDRLSAFLRSKVH